MNSIPTRQNDQEQLERLAAMRELYSSAKNWHGLQIIATVILPVSLALISTFQNKYSTFSAVFGLSVFLLDIYYIDSSIKIRKEKGAKIQELFDCILLHIPQSPLKIVSDITVEDVLEHYNAFSKIPSNIEKIKNWYVVDGIESLPISIARIICQRTNCWWDSNLRKNYATFLNTLTLSVLVSVIAIGIYNNTLLIDIALIVSSLVPFLQFCIKQKDDNNEAANRLKELVSFSIAVSGTVSPSLSGCGVVAAVVEPTERISAGNTVDSFLQRLA